MLLAYLSHCNNVDTPKINGELSQKIDRDSLTKKMNIDHAHKL